MCPWDPNKQPHWESQAFAKVLGPGMEWRLQINRTKMCQKCITLTDLFYLKYSCKHIQAFFPLKNVIVLPLIILSKGNAGRKCTWEEKKDGSLRTPSCIPCWSVFTVKKENLSATLAVVLSLESSCKFILIFLGLFFFDKLFNFLFSCSWKKMYEIFSNSF